MTPLSSYKSCNLDAVVANSRATAVRKALVTLLLLFIGGDVTAQQVDASAAGLPYQVDLKEPFFRSFLTAPIALCPVPDSNEQRWRTVSVLEMWHFQIFDYFGLGVDTEIELRRGSWEYPESLLEARHQDIHKAVSSISRVSARKSGDTVFRVTVTDPFDGRTLRDWRQQLVLTQVAPSFWRGASDVIWAKSLGKVQATGNHVVLVSEYELQTPPKVHSSAKSKQVYWGTHLQPRPISNPVWPYWLEGLSLPVVKASIDRQKLPSRYSEIPTHAEYSPVCLIANDLAAKPAELSSEEDMILFLALRSLGVKTETFQVKK